MTGKGKERPALGDVDLSDMPASLATPNPEEMARRRAFASSLESGDFIARSAEAGLVRVMRPAAPQAAPAPPEPAPRKLRSQEPSFTVRLPEYLQQEVRLAAVRQKTTVRLIVLNALRGTGFTVQDEDMTDDRGIVAKLRSRNRGSL
jgi:hypothetical protein